MTHGRDLRRHGCSDAVWRVLFGAAGAFALITLAVGCLLPFRDSLDSGTSRS